MNGINWPLVRLIVCIKGKSKAKVRLFIGTHAHSESVYASALEVLAVNKVEGMSADRGEYTPMPADHLISSTER